MQSVKNIYNLHKQKLKSVKPAATLLTHQVLPQNSHPTFLLDWLNRFIHPAPLPCNAQQQYANNEHYEFSPSNPHDEAILGDQIPVPREHPVLQDG